MQKHVINFAWPNIAANWLGGHGSADLLSQQSACMRINGPLA